MPKLELFIGLLVMLLISSVVLWAFWDQLPALPGLTSKTADRIETKEGSDELASQQARSLEKIAGEFIGHYSKALANNDQAAADRAKSLLSEHGRNVVETDALLIDGLRRLVRNLPTPQTFEIGVNRKQSDHFAEVTTTWVYPDTRLIRYFYFTLENNEWKIDSIQEVQQ